MLGFIDADAKINKLVAKRKFAAAIKLIRSELKHRPGNAFLRQTLGDLLAAEGRLEASLQLHKELLNEYLQRGFTAKAVALLKKMQRLHPAHSKTFEDKIRNLILMSKQSRDDEPLPLAPEETPASEAIPVSALEEGDEEIMASIPAGQHEDAEELPPSEKLEALLKSPLFNQFSEQELLTFVSELESRTHEPGEIICSEGEPGSRLMVVFSGSLRVYVRSLSGMNKQIRILSEGDFFGEISLLGNKVRTATITAMERVEILVLTEAALAKLTNEHPEVTKTLEGAYNQRVNSPEEIKARYM